MMRSILAISALTILWTAWTPLSAQPKEPNHVKFGVPKSVLGAGDTIENSQKNALRNAEEKINEAMRNHKLTSFKVDQEFIDKYVLDNKKSHSCDDLPIENQAPLKQWETTSAPTATGGAKSSAAIAGGSAVFAHLCAMIGISILLLAGFGYIRLDEYTNRRFTTALRHGHGGRCDCTGRLVDDWKIVDGCQSSKGEPGTRFPFFVRRQLATGN